MTLQFGTVAIGQRPRAARRQVFRIVSSDDSGRVSLNIVLILNLLMDYRLKAVDSRTD